ncbi:cytochrome P450 [Pseudonocardia acaciae]|uniref:cytochrome P450 n=1 Tax=Pseudonocardia acaciae TaxID=551276 RepID=UPI0004901589|nr:cytochrome P450 [Pseudonocardia acaciae]
MTEPPRAHDWPVDDLDGVRLDPLLARLLAEEPLARIRMRFGEGDAWLATRYEDVKRIAMDPRLSRAATVDRPITSMTPHVLGLPGGIGRTDPPEHTRLARLAMQGLSVRRVQRLRPRAEAIADELLDRMAGQEPPIDLTEALTAPFAMRMVSELLGVPEADWERVRGWQRVVWSTTTARQDSAATKAELGRYLGELAARKAAEPGDDLVSTLVAARDAGNLSTPELISLGYILALNGVEMVRNMGATMAYVLLGHPDLLARLRADPALLPTAIEELLRYIPNRNGVGLPRIATEDLPIGDATVRAGEAVYVSYIAANRDPEVFDDPHRLDVDRDSNPHLAFGHGIHHCAGASLTRMELRVLLARLVARFPGLRLACEPERVRWLRGVVNRGPESLPVTW